MKTEIEAQFERFRKKEVVARRISILLAIIPFIIGSAWMYFSYKEVQRSEKEYAAIKLKSLSEETRYNDLHAKKQQLELELMNTYGLPIENILKSSGKDIILNKSIAANDVIKKLSDKYTPDRNIIIRYYYKTVDDEKIVLSLKALGYSFEQKQANERMTSQKTNSIWFGSNVSIKDCKIVALALMRAGIEIKAIRGFKNNAINPSFKANIIEIGGDRMLEYNRTPPLTVAQVDNATQFLRDN
jgi:hypothetical protein